MQTWKDIVATAVVGTEQHSLNLQTRNDELGKLLSQIESNDREESLLNAASITAVYRRAGIVARIDTKEAFELSEIEERIRVSNEAGQHLGLMLQGEFRTVLPEWLQAVDKVLRRVPEEYLPALFDEGRIDPSLHELIIPVSGKRGEWLSRQNAEWMFAAPADAREVWDTGNRTQRLLLLDKLRQREPRLGREALMSTWQQESAKDRTAFLEKLAVGVSYDDEEFLNTALQDRSSDVRRVAREVLSRLPRAKFTQGLTALTSQFLSMKKPLLGKSRIEVSLPDEPIEWLKANGIEIDTPPRSRVAQAIGPKAWCLKELVALTPLNHWVDQWQKKPIAIVHAALDGEWATPFSEGLVRAAERDRDPEWIEALISHWLNERKQEVNYSSPIELSMYLPTARLEALIKSLMKAASDGLNDTHAVLLFLRVHPGQWSDELSRSVINSIKTRIPRIRKDDTIDWQTRGSLKRFAHHISPDLYDELALGWPMQAEAWPSWAKAVDEFQSLLAFRRDMHNAIGMAPVPLKRN